MEASPAVQAIVIDERGQPTLREMPRPRRREGEALLAVRAVGLCGSDTEKLGDPSRAGSVLGHEIAGDVLAGPLAGARVVVGHRVPCGTCTACASGHETTCRHYLASGLRPGGFASHLVCPASHVATTVLELPDHVSYHEATLVEPLGCVLRAIERLPGGRGLVVGCGAVGRLALRALGARGDVTFAVDADARRLEAALADAALPLADETVDFAIVIAPRGLDRALAALRPGGTAIVFAAEAQPAPVDLDRVYRNELQLAGVRSATPRTLRLALDAIASGRIAVADLVSDVLPLDRFHEGLERHARRRGLKVVFEP